MTTLYGQDYLDAHFLVHNPAESKDVYGAKLICALAMIYHDENPADELRFEEIMSWDLYGEYAEYIAPLHDLMPPHDWEPTPSGRGYDVGLSDGRNVHVHPLTGYYALVDATARQSGNHVTMISMLTAVPEQELRELPLVDYMKLDKTYQNFVGGAPGSGSRTDQPDSK